MGRFPLAREKEVMAWLAAGGHEDGDQERSKEGDTGSPVVSSR